MLPKVLFIPLCTISSWQHNELRYALRSWEMYGPPIEKLLIIGYIPDWLQDIHRIPFVDRWSKPVNIIEKVKIAAKHYDSFIFANDDHFLLESMTELPYYRAGKLVDYKGGGETFMRYVNNTWQKWPHGLFFDVHTPMVVMSSVVEQISADKDILFKSAYGNTAGMLGIEFDDCKLPGHMKREEFERYISGRPFFSTGEAVPVDVKKWLEEKFPEKSRWEK